LLSNFIVHLLCLFAPEAILQPINTSFADLLAALTELGEVGVQARRRPILLSCIIACTGIAPRSDDRNKQLEYGKFP
jgi:hypothetical protein